MTLAFVDTETTGLDPDRHQIWEVGLIVDGQEHHWFLPVDLGRADAIALKIGQYHERHPLGRSNRDRDTYTLEPEEFAEEFAELTAGRHLVGAVVSFDEERLRKLLRANDACPEWHYHLIDVEALAVGYIAALRSDEHAHFPVSASGEPPSLPWNSEDLSREVGVDPDQFDRHTALGDARWAKAIYEAVMGKP